MPYTILEHTADVRLLVEGRTLEELFAEALRGMMELMKPELISEAANAPGRATESRREVHVESPSVTALLVDFLSEALCLAHSNREIYEVASIEVLFGTTAREQKSAQARVPAPPNCLARIRAVLRGRPVESFGEDIKAVTYHEAEIRKTAAGHFETKLVFDI